MFELESNGAYAVLSSFTGISRTATCLTGALHIPGKRTDRLRVLMKRSFQCHNQGQILHFLLTVAFIGIFSSLRNEKGEDN
jgi:hypothetical protein